MSDDLADKIEQTMSFLARHPPRTRPMMAQEIYEVIRELALLGVPVVRVSPQTRIFLESYYQGVKLRECPLPNRPPDAFMNIDGAWLIEDASLLPRRFSIEDDAGKVHTTTETVT